MPGYDLPCWTVSASYNCNRYRWGGRVQLGDIIGYRLDMARCAGLRCLHALLADTAFKPADTTALLLVKERPGCDQTELGHALAGNRSVGMKVATRLETRGLLVRSGGRDRRSKGLYITAEGEAVLADLVARHSEAEAVLAFGLTEGERGQLLHLLRKVERAVLDHESAHGETRDEVHPASGETAPA